MISENFSAINSWFCYIYQGKLAIYIVLEYIYDLLINLDKNKFLNELEKFELEIEFKEDFAIKYDNQYLTIHQVKSGNSNVPLNRNDIFDFLVKVHSNSARGYLHTSQYIVRPQFFIETKAKIESLRNNLSSNPAPEPDGRQGKTTVERLLYLIKNRCPATNIKTVLENYLVALELFIEENKEDEYFSIHNKIFNNKDDIYKDSLVLIEKILNKFDPTNRGYYKTKEVKIIYSLITKKLDDYIENEKFERKISVTSNSVNTLKFNDLFDIIYTDVQKESFSADYIVYLFKNDIYEVYENKFLQTYAKEYADCTSQKCSECKNCNCNLYSQINKIQEISFEDFKVLFNNIVLKNINSPEATNYRPRINEIRDLLFKTLKEIPVLKYDKNTIYTFKSNKSYSLTLDYSDILKDIEEKLNGNNSLYELVYEIDRFITKNISDETITFDSAAFPKLSIVELKELEDNNIKDNAIEEQQYNIYGTNWIELISIEKAKEVLNNE